MPKNSITWRDVLDNKVRYINFDNMIIDAIAIGYEYINWKDVIYKCDCRIATGQIVKNGDIVSADSESLWPTNISRYNDA